MCITITCVCVHDVSVCVHEMGLFMMCVRVFTTCVCAFMTCVYSQPVFEIRVRIQTSDSSMNREKAVHNAPFISILPWAKLHDVHSYLFSC